MNINQRITCGLKYQGRSRAWVERLVCDHGVFVKEPKTVRELSAMCSREYGGTPEMWIARNKDKCSFFGSPNKVVPRYTYFFIPAELVVEANRVFFRQCPKL